MSENHQKPLRLSMNPVALSSYAVSVCSFAGAAIGLVSEHFPSGGLAAVGGFYLIVGLLSPNPAKSNASQGSGQELGGITSGADNLVAESMASPREAVSNNRKRDLVGSTR